MEETGKKNLKLLYQFIISNKKEAIELLNKYGIETNKDDSANHILNLYIKNTDNFDLYADLLSLMQQKKMFNDSGSTKTTTSSSSDVKKKGIDAEKVVDLFNKGIDFANSIKSIVEKKKEQKKQDNTSASTSTPTPSNVTISASTKDPDTKITITAGDDDKKKKTKKLIIISSVTLVVISVISFLAWTYIKNKRKTISEI
jgi:hypothetical protein